MPIGNTEPAMSPVNRKVVIAGSAGAATLVALIGLGFYVDSQDTATTASAAPASTTAAAAPVESKSPLTCGPAREVTVISTADSSVVDTWKIVRESDTATTGCTRVSVYRGTEKTSTLDLAQGVSAVDGDQGLWIYREGSDTVAADQQVPNDNLQTVWLIARTTDGHTVSANLSDGKLAPGK